MKTLRPKFVVLSGAVIGMVSAAAAYGSVSTGTAATSTPLLKVASVTSAPAAPCAQGMELEHGVCVVHVEDAVNSGPSSSSDDSTETQGLSTPAVDHEAEAADDATEAAEDATEAPDDATEAAEHASEDRD